MEKNAVAVEVQVNGDASLGLNSHNAARKELIADNRKGVFKWISM
jgi:hypothetical protein